MVVYATILPEVRLLGAALFLVLRGFVTQRRPGILWGIAMGALLFASFLTIDMMFASVRPGGSLLALAGLDLYEVGGGTLGVQRFSDLHLAKDLFSLFFHLVFLLVAFLPLLPSRPHAAKG